MPTLRVLPQMALLRPAHASLHCSSTLPHIYLDQRACQAQGYQSSPHRGPYLSDPNYRPQETRRRRTCVTRTPRVNALSFSYGSGTA